MPKILPIITDPDPILRKTSRPLKVNRIQDPELQKLCDDMELTMREKDGIGLAAPQIGHNLRIITVNTKNGAICMLNPEIKKPSWTKEWGEEGCLSVPEVFGRVRRHKQLVCKYYNRTGKKLEVMAKGLMARVIQHEVDHLNGILFTDIAKNIKKYDKNNQQT
jgi:peptide deformylase